MLRHAPRSLGAEGLLEHLGLLLRRHGVPVSRASLNVHTFHPEIFVRNLVWSADSGKTTSETILHFDLILPIYKDSPVALIYQGSGPIRRRLTGPHAQLDFPICRELAAAGSTDYLILPLEFSDGRRTYASFCCDSEGGLGDDHVATLLEIAPYLALRVELASSYFATSSLLQLYLGKNAARRVLAGNFKRGHGDTIEAAVWYCDLRGFTEMSDHNSAGQVVEMLDTYFECVADAIRESGGEILKFIGDAVLAIFDFADSSPERACRHALDAATHALDAVDDWNQKNHLGDDRLRLGVALHAGSVLYGNIGSRERLDFTVIGSAINEVCRLEPLCKTIGVPLVMSQRFTELLCEVEADDADLVGMGRFVLRGVRDPQEVFSLRSRLPRAGRSRSRA